MVHHHLDRPTVIVTIENVYTLCVLATASKGKNMKRVFTVQAVSLPFCL